MRRLLQLLSPAQNVETDRSDLVAALKDLFPFPLPEQRGLRWRWTEPSAKVKTGVFVYRVLRSLEDRRRA